MARSKLFIPVALVLTVAALGSAGDAQTILHRHYRMKKLMPTGTITAIEPAGRYVWFGGWALRPGEDQGLALYDKQADRWELFLESEQMIADEIATLATEGNRIWVGSHSDWLWNRGLHCYDPETHTNTRYDRDDGLPHWRITGVVPLPEALWVATMSGVARLDRKTQAWMTFTQEDGKIASNFTTCMHADDRNVYVGTFAGFEVCSRRTGKWRSFTTENSILPTAVTDIDSDGQSVWLLSEPDIVVLDRETYELSKWPMNHAPARESVPHNIEVTEDAIFIGSDAGLHAYDRRTGQWRTYTARHGMLSNEVRTLAADDDFVWCAHDLGRGVSRLNQHTGAWDTFHFREGSPSNHIYSLLSDGSTLYVGTLGCGLWKYDINRDLWTNLNLVLKSGDVRFSYLGERSRTKYSDIRQMILHDGRVWMATNHGLCAHRPGAEVDIEVLSEKSFPMLCLAVHKGKVLCGGQKQGLRTYDPAANSWEDTGKKLGLDRKIAAIQCSDETMWLSDGERVLHFSAADDKPAALDAPTQGIRALLLGHGKLWVGTDHGLWVVDTANLAASEIDKSRLPSQIILSLSSWRDRIWIGTEGGLAACTRDGTDWQVLDKENALADNNVSCTSGDATYLWVGTLGGGFSRLAGISLPRGAASGNDR
ncbi:MAG TPA: hypothetical protein VM487_14870 [Phycisphaerae bacterium]|nr:hypothetical protein [Phycisphaerae bacterium]HUW33425.1 hypothetical protein [Planctomycetota bacterium]